MRDRLAKIRELLDAHEQGHLLDGWERLDEPARTGLLDQLQLLPWDTIEVVRDSILHRVEANPPPSNLEPPDVCDPADASAGAFFASVSFFIFAARVFARRSSFRWSASIALCRSSLRAAS